MSEPGVLGGGGVPGPAACDCAGCPFNQALECISKPVIHLFVKPSLETSEAHELQMRYSRESLQPSEALILEVSVLFVLFCGGFLFVF